MAARICCDKYRYTIGFKFCPICAEPLDLFGDMNSSKILDTVLPFINGVVIHGVSSPVAIEGNYDMFRYSGYDQIPEHISGEIFAKLYHRCDRNLPPNQWLSTGGIYCKLFNYNRPERAPGDKSDNSFTLRNFLQHVAACENPQISDTFEMKTKFKEHGQFIMTVSTSEFAATQLKRINQMLAKVGSVYQYGGKYYSWNEIELTPVGSVIKLNPETHFEYKRTVLGCKIFYLKAEYSSIGNLIKHSNHVGETFETSQLQTDPLTAVCRLLKIIPPTASIKIQNPKTGELMEISF